MLSAPGKRPHLCVLQPDYADSTVEHRNYDPPRDLSPLLPGAHVEHLFLRKGQVFPQLRDAARRGVDMFINLCQGQLDWDVPSIDVIWHLDRLRLPYTGPSARLYDPCKTLMKYVAHVQGVPTPPWIEAHSLADCERAVALGFPLFVKPAHAGDSLGIDDGARVDDVPGLRRQCEALLARFDRLLIERYIDGREFTVLLAASVDPDGEPVVFRPIEYVFVGPERFKTYDLKARQHHPARNVPVTDITLAQRLGEAARRIFRGFQGEGYARLDFRMAADGQLHFLEVNFACCVFYPPGFEGSADYILASDPIGHAGFLRHLIAEGRARHLRRFPRYSRRGTATSGFGIFADAAISAGEVVFAGEERSQRIVTRDYVERTWSADTVADFRAYAYPLSDEVFVLWDRDPDDWAPQNHSCAPNTAYRGLDVVALRDIAAGEELTLDYADFCNDTAAAFDCRCGAATCRGRVNAPAGNSVTARERARHGR
jgi:hypothetical protein